MKVRATVTVDFDLKAWMLANGLNRKQVRADMLSYIQEALSTAAMFEDCDAEVTVK